MSVLKENRKFWGRSNFRKSYKKINKLENSFRHTTLFDTGIDMCLLTYCNYIEGSFHSSFSRVAVMLNVFRRKEFEKANYELNRYVFHK